MLSLDHALSNADSPAIVHRRYTVHLLESTIEIGSMFEATAVGDVLDVQGTFAVPAGLVVEIRNLPADGAAVPVLRTSSLEGRENLASAAFVGEDGAALPGGYQLFFRRGVLFAAIPAGFQVIIR